MAVLNSNKLTLLDWVNRYEPPTVNSLASAEELMVKALAEFSPFLDDATFVESNKPMSHRVIIRAGAPPVYWRAINQGVPNSKSHIYQVDETCGVLEACSQIDTNLVELNGDSVAFRAREAVPFIIEMAREQTKTLFYGDSREDPRQYRGLSARYSATTGANSAANVIDAGGKGDTNTSIWLVCWSPDTVFCIFPKGSKAGLKSTDDGIVTIYDDHGNPLRVYQTHYQWKNGLVVKDWRYAVRIANVDMAHTPEANLPKLMARALSKIPSHRFGHTPAFYVNQDVFTELYSLATQEPHIQVVPPGAPQAPGSKDARLYFMRIPVRLVYELTDNEARIL